MAQPRASIRFSHPQYPTRDECRARQPDLEICLVCVEAEDWTCFQKIMDGSEALNLFGSVVADANAYVVHVHGEDML